MLSIAFVTDNPVRFSQHTNNVFTPLSRGTWADHAVVLVHVTGKISPLISMNCTLNAAVPVSTIVSFVVLKFVPPLLVIEKPTFGTAAFTWLVTNAAR